MPIEGAEMSYRGTVALNTPWPGQPQPLVLLALEVWEDHLTLRGTQLGDAKQPSQGLPFRAWQIAASDGTRHRNSGVSLSGVVDDRVDWHARFKPSLMADVSSLHLSDPTTGADGRTPAAVGLDLSWRWPAASRVADPIELNEGESLPADALAVRAQMNARVIQADDVVAIDARLSGPAIDVSILSAELWPTWFNVDVINHGAPSGESSFWHHSWLAVDEAGRRHVGAVLRSDRRRSKVQVTFTPALPHGTGELVLGIPGATGGGLTGARISLP